MEFVQSAVECMRWIALSPLFALNARCTYKIKLIRSQTAAVRAVIASFIAQIILCFAPSAMPRVIRLPQKLEKSMIMTSLKEKDVETAFLCVS